MAPVRLGGTALLRIPWLAVYRAQGVICALCRLSAVLVLLVGAPWWVGAPTTEGLAAGYLRTGDIGEVRDGFTFITGRIKEMIITAGGENMAPVLLENAIKERLPALSNVVMIGDKQKYLIALMTVKLEPDGKGGFTD